MKPVFTSESTDQENYLSALQALIPALKVDNRKTVISTIITNQATVNWAEVADILFDTYPESFCHIYYTPRLGAWIGATPELLLSADRSMSQVATMSLAGTKPHNNSWDDKNRHEQAIVTDFIVDNLRPIFSEINISPVETIHYGNIDHLCTHITASGTSCRYSEIVDILSPTPAVAGLPRDRALEEIGEIESHDRECYGGYITVADANGSQSFVNLRCAYFYEDKYVVYAGGGITGESVPQTEWLETRLKSAALINIINSATNN
ncbi:MAG: chorismate-binding protein [Muribaculaceae bacterium]